MKGLSLSCAPFWALLVITLSTQSWAQKYVPGEVIVKYKKGFNTLSAQSKVSQSFVVKSVYNQLGVQKLALKGSRDVKALIEELKQDPSVEYAEPNYILSKPTEMSDDSNYYSQEDLERLGGIQSYMQSYADIKVEDAWVEMSALAQNPTPVVVAVIDTGVDYTHPVFVNANAIWTNTDEVPNNGLDDDHNGFIDDVRGWNFHDNSNNPMDDDDHGTHVAGIVFGIGQALGSGAESRIKIMPLKFLGADGSGTTSAAINAINYAINNGARVINNSWGGESYSQALHDALTSAYNAGIFMAAAAGNYSSNNDSKPLYPASYPIPGQMSVAASNDMDYLASFSNYGVSSVHLGSPGVSIYSTTPNASYRYMNGTSMASPLVAGLAAMMIREAPQLSGYQVKSLLMSSSDVRSSLSNKLVTSARINALSAIEASKNEAGTAFYQPGYAAVNTSGRQPAGQATGGGGCGTITTTPGEGPTGPNATAVVVICLSLAPLLVWSILRLRIKSKVDNRKHPRFLMNSAITVNVGGQELVGQMKTISVGGLSFNAEHMLEKGGIVSIKIHSPEGSEQIEVQGQIVWSQANQSYGVQFKQAPQSIIERWTKGLLKAS
jgi:subtilisin family serine protease